MSEETQPNVDGNKFGLVIQGPMTSFGLSGSQFGRGKYSQSIESLVEVDCRKNVIQMATEAVKIFDAVAICTWTAPDLDSFSVNLPKGVSFLALDDPGGRKGKYKGRDSAEVTFYSNNKVRQFFGIESALKLIRSHSIDFAVKIRTDQSIDLHLLRKELNVFKLKNKGDFFFVPYILKSVPWAIPDFYIAGQVDRFLTLCQLMQSDFEFHSNVHRDLFFKGSLLNDPTQSLELMSMICRRTDIVNERERMLVNSLLNNWLIGSRNLFKSLTWRNQPVEFCKEDLAFVDEMTVFENLIVASEQTPDLNFGQLFHKILGLNFWQVVSILLRRITIFIRARSSKMVRKAMANSYKRDLK